MDEGSRDRSAESAGRKTGTRLRLRLPVRTQSVGDRSAQGGWGVWDAIGDEKEGSGDWGEEGRASRGDWGVG